MKHLNKKPYTGSWESLILQYQYFPHKLLLKLKLIPIVRHTLKHMRTQSPRPNALYIGLEQAKLCLKKFSVTAVHSPQQPCCCYKVLYKLQMRMPVLEQK